MTDLNYSLLTTGVQGIDSLAELALDLNWSWNHRTGELWRLPRDSNGIPTAWVSRMWESMARLTPRFSANRTVREYTGKHYLATAAAYHARAANSGAAGRQIDDWRRSLDEKGATLHIGMVKVETRGEQHLFEVGVCLNSLDPDAVRVELYADNVTDTAPFRQEMQHVEQVPSSPGCHVYCATVCAKRAAADYTARVVPHHDGFAIPLEEGRILWQQ